MIARLRRPIVGYAIFLFFLAAPALCQLIYIPTDDPINSLIEELQSKGYLSQLSQTERPWLVSDVARAILSDQLNFAPSDKRIANDILRYLKPPQVIKREVVVDGFEAGLAMRGLSRESRDGYFYWRDLFLNRGLKAEMGSIFSAGFWFSQESRWGLDTRLLFDTDGTRYPWYHGRPHNARIIGQFDHAYFSFQFGRFDILIGRERLIWGPSPRGSLLLNDSSPPLDLIEYGFALKPFKLSGFGARIDDYVDPVSGEVNRRFLSGHRLRINPGKGWELALTEIYLYGGPDRLPELYYNNPLVLFYWEAQNRYKDDNAFWAADVSWTLQKIGRFYSQFVADDIQRQHRGPQKFAMQFGTHLEPARFGGWSGLFELNLVDTYVFGHRRQLNAYLNWGWPIGRLDSDQREYFAGIYKRLGDAFKIGAEFVRRDKGAYDAADYQPWVVPFGVKFPSGVVEETDNLGLVLSWHAVNRLDGGLSAGHETVRNFSHDAGRSVNQFYVTLQISYSISTGLPFWKRSS